MTLRPITWLLYLPLAALPWLAAAALQTRSLAAGALYWRGVFFIPAHHWFWILVSAGLGVWVGWHTAAQSPKEGA